MSPPRHLPPAVPADYLELNRRLWNAKTAFHLRSDFYDVAGFTAGKTSLNPPELELLGDVAGQRILHLQCHFGLDTLSLARLGAHVTGVDLADEAIAAARALNEQLGLAAGFVQADVLALPASLDGQFDVVFAPYGVLGWLPDLTQWAAGVARCLRPGGRLVLVELHPAVWMFDNDFTRVEYSYFNRQTIIEQETGTYADRAAPLHETSVSWNHSLGEVVGALLGQGLAIRHFEEYDYSCYDCLNGLEPAPGGGYHLASMPGKLPLMYSVVAQKP
ncbi:class I SAM-dependent methyltransferase [Hymenobacter actinosclerus]|uniref:Methyltransferase domain-containing protein n=1 Tax=Hymenobacter actinosclerus TaxID=82805 RepID=A0A1I0BI38_9BACT|nr:class I SAM-dependent methyltransferase [Hymenobacter actinosclerus]SET06589.1 Methyltransferase domain-containing protein [Hymenobacter actinosclerus]